MAQLAVREKEEENVITARKKMSRSRETWLRIRKSKTAMLGLIVMSIIMLIVIFADVLVDYESQVIVPDMKNRLQAPNSNYPLGTDAMGRDILARLIYGTRISIIVAISAVTLQVLGGVTLGSIAGFWGGKVEGIIMRIVDVFLAIPNLLMAITIASALGQSLINMILAIGIAGIPAMTRIVRATALTVREQDYMEAGKALGAKSRQLITFHLLPNCIAPIIIQATLRLASAILSTTSLSFLGIGIKPPMPEWGNMLSGGKDFIRSAPHIVIFPGLAILITLLAINLLGDGLRDALDPRLRR